MAEPDHKKIAAEWASGGFSCDLWTDPPGQRWEDFRPVRLSITCPPLRPRRSAGPPAPRSTSQQAAAEDRRVGSLAAPSPLAPQAVEAHRQVHSSTPPELPPETP